MTAKGDKRRETILRIALTQSKNLLHQNIVFILALISSNNKYPTIVRQFIKFLKFFIDKFFSIIYYFSIFMIFCINEISTFFMSRINTSNIRFDRDLCEIEYTYGKFPVKLHFMLTGGEEKFRESFEKIRKFRAVYFTRDRENPEDIAIRGKKILGHSKSSFYKSIDFEIPDYFVTEHSFIDECPDEMMFIEMDSLKSPSHFDLSLLMTLVKSYLVRRVSVVNLLFSGYSRIMDSRRFRIFRNQILRWLPLSRNKIQKIGDTNFIPIYFEDKYFVLPVRNNVSKFPKLKYEVTHNKVRYEFEVTDGNYDYMKSFPVPDDMSVRKHIIAQPISLLQNIKNVFSDDDYIGDMAMLTTGRIYRHKEKKLTTKKDKTSSSSPSMNIFDMKLSAIKRSPESISFIEILSDVLEDMELDTVKVLIDDIIDPVITGYAKSRIEEMSEEEEEDSQDELEKLLEEISEGEPCLERSEDELDRSVSENEEDYQNEIEKLLEEISDDEPCLERSEDELTRSVSEED